MNNTMLLRLALGACLSILLLAARPVQAYSILSHQGIIDSCWVRSLRPALERRFPGATAEQLREAKAYAYGGSIIQDMGYYPFGSKLFTNLAHYVRSADFVRHLLQDAHDRNGYAFALGALSHYAADIYGHEMGINKSVPILFPKLGAEYGPVVTYEQDPLAHGRTEFAFDVLQLAAGHYRSNQYHDFIGFKVDKELLEKAFEETYGLPLSKIILNVDLAIGSYRFAVRNLIPLANRAAWRANRHKLREVNHRVRRRDYIYKESKNQFEQEYGSNYERPGFGARIVAGVIRILPKVGKLRNLKFVTPTPEAQKLFAQSFQQTVTTFRQFLGEQTAMPGQALAIPNIDIDTGKQTHLGEYSLADRTYGEWLRSLAKDDFKDVKAPMRQNILAFFADGNYAPIDKEEKEKGNREETAKALAQLRALPAAK